MDLKKIMLGLAAWFLGIIVPVLHHAILVSHVIKAESTDIYMTVLVFKNLPWIDFVYLLAMAIVGVILIITGMKKSSQ